MNFLAHAYLSFNEPEMLAGNMMADFVRGSRFTGISPAMQAGIRLHRAIDSFTDTHPATHEAKKIFLASCGHYSGVFIDIIYDYFLANDERFFTSSSLASFARHTYNVLSSYEEKLPPRFRQLFFYMRTQDWLYGYRTSEGVHHAFHNIYRRAKYLETSEAAFNTFENNQKELKKFYQSFMPSVSLFAEKFQADEIERLAEKGE